MTRSIILWMTALLACSAPKPASDQPNSIESWITTGDRNSLLAKSSERISFNSVQNPEPVIEVDTTIQFQTMDGFGFALTGGSAQLINRLDPLRREALLKELFLTEGNGIGISYLRISIGASDLDDHVFSYDDSKGDEALTAFSMEEDRKNLIPLLKDIIRLNPQIKIMASPWSAPAWMKSNGSPIGGSLDPQYEDVYAHYLLKYIRAMRDEGIMIDAITMQNEPENPKNNPSMLMTAAEEARFVKNNLGPAFIAEGIRTKIVIFDHNCDHPEYPITVLNDAEAKKFIDGSAFHMYLGKVEAMTEVHRAHPDRNIYFTEQWTSSKGKFDGDLRWHIKNLIIGATRNWSRTVLEWNLAADPMDNPHTDQGGCTECQGALTIGDAITRNVSYYIIAHASKFVRAGSVRVESTMTDNLPNVAFVAPGGKKVLIVMNDSEEPKKFSIKFNGSFAAASLPGGAVGTYVW